MANWLSLAEAVNQIADRFPENELVTRLGSAEATAKTFLIARLADECLIAEGLLDGQPDYQPISAGWWTRTIPDGFKVRDKGAPADAAYDPMDVTIVNIRRSEIRRIISFSGVCNTFQEVRIRASDLWQTESTEKTIKTGPGAIEKRRKEIVEAARALIRQGLKIEIMSMKERGNAIRRQLGKPTGSRGYDDRTIDRALNKAVK
ncbi:MAG TPA: hypothetical protein VMF05_05960 [Stellaceae bacterium]|nr:hypothetical protein [Stellaceae bacterium]